MNADFPDESAFGEAESREIEALLRKISLTQPTAALDARVTRALAPRSSHRSARPLLMGIAAMLAIAAGIAPLMEPRVVPVHQATQSRIDPNAKRQPIPMPLATGPRRDGRRLRIEQTISSVSDAGVMTVADGLPFHCYRKRSVRNVWVVDPRTGARTRMSIPTDEVVVLPIHAF